MQRILRSIVPTTLSLLFTLASAAQAEEKKSDPTGNWTWTVTGRDGTPRQASAKLKLDGDKLTGTVSGRLGETAIEDAKLAGEEISFKVTREFNGTKFVQRFAGKMSGDTIKGKIELDRDGQPQSVDWEAKREAAKPAEPAAKPAQP